MCSNFDTRLQPDCHVSVRVSSGAMFPLLLRARASRRAKRCLLSTLAIRLAQDRGLAVRSGPDRSSVTSRSCSWKCVFVCFSTVADINSQKLHPMFHHVLLVAVGVPKGFLDGETSFATETDCLQAQLMFILQEVRPSRSCLPRLFRRGSHSTCSPWGQRTGGDLAVHFCASSHRFVITLALLRISSEFAGMVEMYRFSVGKSKCYVEVKCDRLAGRGLDLVWRFLFRDAHDTRQRIRFHRPVMLFLLKRFVVWLRREFRVVNCGAELLHKMCNRRSPIGVDETGRLTTSTRTRFNTVLTSDITRHGFEALRTPPHFPCGQKPITKSMPNASRQVSSKPSSAKRGEEVPCHFPVPRGRQWWAPTSS